MACNSLTLLARECGKNTKAGIKDDVYLIAFSDLTNVTGSTEVWAYGTGTTATVSTINITGATKFVKYGAVVDQNSIKEDYTYDAGTGTYDIKKTLTFTLNNVGSVAGKLAVENLVAAPVAALVKLRNGQWIAFGLNGAFMAATVAGSVDSKSNNRVITLSGSDTEFLQIVDPLLIPNIVAF